MPPTLSDALGPSIFLMILDLFLENPDDLMNMREISRRLDKNPGSVSPVIPKLLEKGYLTGTKVGKVSVAYGLDTSNETVRHLMELHRNLQIPLE